MLTKASIRDDLKQAELDWITAGKQGTVRQAQHYFGLIRVAGSKNQGARSG